MPGPERGIVRGVPRPVELAVRPDRGDDHPVEWKQQSDDEGGQRNVEEDPAPPNRALDHRRSPGSNSVIAGRDPAIHAAPRCWEMSGSSPGMTEKRVIAQRVSTRRIYKSWTM